MTERGGANICCGILVTPPPPNAPLPRRQYILIYLDDRERGGAPLSFVGFWRPAMPPLPRHHNT